MESLHRNKHYVFRWKYNKCEPLSIKLGILLCKNNFSHIANNLIAIAQILQSYTQSMDTPIKIKQTKKKWRMIEFVIFNISFQKTFNRTINYSWTNRIKTSNKHTLVTYLLYARSNITRIINILLFYRSKYLVFELSSL